VIVMKFGGSSVANREQIEKVMAIVRSFQHETPLVVTSAHKGITDALIESARSAASGVHAGERVIARQTEIASSLECSPELLAPLFAEIRDLLRGIRLVKELSLRSLDYISSFGERMSARCMAFRPSTPCETPVLRQKATALTSSGVQIAQILKPFAASILGDDHPLLSGIRQTNIGHTIEHKQPGGHIGYGAGDGNPHPAE